jgi:hypothetical protein
MIGVRSGSVRRWPIAFAAALALSLTFASGAQAAVPGWLGQEQVDPHNSALNTVSCSSPSFCVAGGLDLVVQDHAVQTDISSELSSDTDEVAAISCAASTTFCAVTDDSGGAYTLTGETLSARTQVASNGFDAVSCPLSSFCMAIDALGNTFRLSGGVWVPASKLGSLASTLSDLQLSCVSAQFCLATLPGSGNDEDYYTYNGSNWSGASVLESTGAVESGLSCTSSTFCVAADTSDNTLKFNGASWTSPQHQGSGTTLNDQFYVSCAGTFCLEDSFEDGSTYLTSDGSTWSPGANLKDPDTGNGAGGPTACTSSTMCVVVDLSGIGNTYALPDTLATQPSLTGSAVAGSTISLSKGTATNPGTSIVDAFQRCLGGCAALSGTSYTTTPADVDANIQDSETTGVGLDIEGPFVSNVIGPIIAPSSGSGTGGGGTGAGGTGGAGSGGEATISSPAPSPASIGSAKISGTSAQVTVSCPSANSAACSVTLTLVVTEKLKGTKVISILARTPKITTRKVTIGTASATVTPGARKQLTVSLNGTGKKLLAARHTLTANLSVTQRGATAANRTLTFKVSRKKQK